MEWMISSRLGAVSDVVRNWYVEHELRQLVADDLAVEIERIDDTEFAREFQQHCPVPGVPEPGAYNNQVITLADGSRCLAGIRFRGADVSRPFVDLVAVEGTFDHDRIADVVDETDTAWGRFDPRAVRILHPDPIGFLDADARGGQPDQFIVAGRIHDLRGKPTVDAESGRVHIRRATGLEWYDRYVAELEDLFRADPRRAEMTRAESRDDLAETHDAGLLFEIFVDDQWAGVLAASRDAGYGMRGHYMQEVMLAHSYRGQGLASEVQRQLMGLLPAEPGDALFGTIDARNRPSLRTALSVGREIVGGYLWLYPRRTGNAAPIVES